MSLFKKLQDGDTQLKSLKFGNDRPNGGSSKQPYIKKGLINGTINPSLYNDFVLRGGILAPLSAAEDVARLTKYFVDIQNPSGILFTAKQNLLSKSGTKTEASSGIGYGNGTINEGIYTPASTIGQALVGFTGTHINKQGIDPTGLLPGLGIVTYQDAINYNQLNRSDDQQINNNRLVSLTTAIVNNDGVGLSYVRGYSLNAPGDDVLISYDGGAGSNVGFGKTNIKFGTSNTKNPVKSILNISNNTSTSDSDKTLTSLFNTWDYSLLSKELLNINSETKEDFRTSLTTSPSSDTFLTSTPGYSTNNIEVKFGLGSPGSRLRNRSNPEKGSILPGNTISEPLDKITSYPIYKSEFADGSRYGDVDDLNDIIPFSIAILNNDDQNKTLTANPLSYKKYMHFRAFIDSFSDSYDADWKSINYMGRAEKLYKYSGFDRKISMAFTIVAQSKDEINVMYDKLNFLASSLAPEYLDSLTTGYMAGNLAYITLGDYINDQPGIITGLSFDIPEESPWEINRETGKDGTIRQLPHMIKVTGINFIPIHKFRPEKQSWQNEFDSKGKGIPNSTLLANPGNQRFIDVENPFNAGNLKQQVKIPVQSNVQQNTIVDPSTAIDANTLNIISQINLNLL
jgi:hypothetical protein